MAGMAGEDARPYIFGDATCAEQDNPMSSGTPLASTLRQLNHSVNH
jgi:hypothetical protein